MGAGLLGVRLESATHPTAITDATDTVECGLGQQALHVLHTRIHLRRKLDLVLEREGWDGRIWEGIVSRLTWEESTLIWEVSFSHLAGYVLKAMRKVFVVPIQATVSE